MNKSNKKKKTNKIIVDFEIKSKKDQFKLTFL